MSAYWDILQGVKAHLDSLNKGIPVRVRKKLVRLPTDPNTLVIISPGKGGEQIAKTTFNRQVFWDYPVVIAYITPGNQQVESGLEAYLDTREAIRDEVFRARIPGVEKVFNARVDPMDVAQMQQELGSAFDTTGILVFYRTKEIREA